MTVNVELLTKYPHLYEQMLRQAKSDLYARLNALNAEMEDIDSALRQFGGDVDSSNSIHSPTSDGYNVKWINARKVKFVIEQSKERLTTSEIVDAILKKDGGGDKTKVLRTISSLLSNSIKNQVDFDRTTNESNEYVYGIKGEMDKLRLEQAKEDFAGLPDTITDNEKSDITHSKTSLPFEL